MEPWEKYFVETPLRWGDLADPSQWLLDEWKTWKVGNISYAAARSVDGSAAVTEILFGPDSVLWRHWHEAGGYYPEKVRPWMRNSGAWNKDRFLALVRAYQHNRGPGAAPLDGPQLASLARDLMKGYLNSIGYEPQAVGPIEEIVPTHIQRFLHYGESR